MRSLRGNWVLSTALLTVGCGGGHHMHERPRSAGDTATPSANTHSTANNAPTQASQVPAVIPPIVMTETQPTTPKSYAAATPQKPKITGLSEDELKNCESSLPPLEGCKPQKTIAEGQSATVNEVRACVARYVAAMDNCLCKAGSKQHCQFAEDQKREIGKMSQAQ